MRSPGLPLFSLTAHSIAARLDTCKFWVEDNRSTLLQGRTFGTGNQTPRRYPFLRQSVPVEVLGVKPDGNLYTSNTRRLAKNRHSVIHRGSGLSSNREGSEQFNRSFFPCVYLRAGASPPHLKYPKLSQHCAQHSRAYRAYPCGKHFKRAEQTLLPSSNEFSLVGEKAKTRRLQKRSRTLIG